MHAPNALAGCDENTHVHNSSVVCESAQAELLEMKGLMQAIHRAACGGCTGPTVSLAALTIPLFTHYKALFFFLYDLLPCSAPFQTFSSFILFLLYIYFLPHTRSALSKQRSCYAATEPDGASNSRGTTLSHSPFLFLTPLLQ